ncbi:MAG: GSCFA domain-containing protein [Phycisphaerae bacterium]|nr:GSCFA domain-containing protein [Phycisphaerae bacterium]
MPYERPVVEDRPIGNSHNIRHYAFRNAALFDPGRFGLADLGLCLTPSFHIDPTDRIFVIGSCFAREIHAALTARGFDAADAGLGNKYNTFSTLQSLRWALEGGFGEHLIVNLDGGKWFDGHRHPFIHHDNLQAAIDGHVGPLRRAGEMLRACDVVIITLGLVEVWRDNLTGTWLNGTPPQRLISNFEDRFSVHRTSHAENLRALLGVFEVLRGVNPDVRIVCTVSPVPLLATFFEADVLVANAYSKSTLRSVATEAIETAARSSTAAIDYFPSYELATLRPREQVWRGRHPTGEPDGRHVRAEFVRDEVVRLFAENYLVEPAPIS